MTSLNRPTALIVGLSGCSSSGKTTLARLLRDIFRPHVTIIHQDDFYKSDAGIPIKEGTDLQDWDCPDAFDMPALVATLKYVRSHGALPPDLVSKEDQNLTRLVPGLENIPTLSELVKHKSLSSLDADADTDTQDSTPPTLSLPSPTLSTLTAYCAHPNPTPIFILDGILLYAPAITPPLAPHLDLFLFLAAPYELAKRRREARRGYVTIEGFWEDPPGYVDAVVWPNYVRDHGWMFEAGDVDGPVDRDAVRREGVVVKQVGEGDIKEVLEWAMCELGGALSKMLADSAVANEGSADGGNPK